MLIFKGKALLVIDRLDAGNSKKHHWEIHPFIQSLNRDDPGGEVPEAFSFIMGYNYHQAPAAAYKMRVGDRIRVQVTFEIHYTQGDGYSTDDDSELYLTRERVLRYQSYNSRRHRKKFYPNH